jgi:hypothetical protein
MKIAIASSGLGHVARGIETWALDTAQALHEHDIDVMLFAAEDPLTEAQRTQSQRTTTKHTKHTKKNNEESGTKNQEPTTRNPEPGTLQPKPLQPKNLPPPCLRVSVVKIDCLKRDDPRAARWARRLPNFLWRWGLKTTYGIEQFTFWLHLWRKLNKGHFDILHVQDPILADWCRRFRRLGLVKTKEILGHGTEEPPEFLRKFNYLQQLAPWHLEQLMATKEHKKSDFNH